MRADCNMEAGDGNHESSPRRRQQQPGSPVPTKQPISDGQETASTKHPASRKSSKSFSDSSTTYTIGFGFVVMTLTASIFQICVIVFRTNEGSISLLRWSLALFLPAYLAMHGLKRNSLSKSGAVAGFVIGFIMTMSSYVFASCMFAFFFLGSAATKVKAQRKRQIEADYMEGGQRSWVQVVCNGGPASAFAVLSILEVGCGEKPLDFSHLYHATFYALGVVGCLACACGDTLASELGTVYSKDEPYLITTLRKVPRGTNGGVSSVGLWASLLGGLFIGVIFYVMTLLCAGGDTGAREMQQWPVIVVAGLSGLVGSLVDSVLGALFQFSGLDQRQRVVNAPGPSIRKICGRDVLDNHAVNLISCALMSWICPYIGLALYHFLHQLGC